MVAELLAPDEVFFDEWSRLRHVTKRSIARAAALAAALELPLHQIPTLVVVGSKGKATAATYASAVLAAAGLHVGTITSPPIITNRERIRIDGTAIDDATYAAIASRVLDARCRLAPATAASGYLSPAGLYLMGGLDALRRERCDVAVVEAGIGGRSDEVSLLDARVLAVTPIFGEHLGVLGDSVDAIAEDKLAIAGPATRVVSALQTADVQQVFARRGIQPVMATTAACAVEGSLLPPGLSSASAAVGIVAARIFLDGTRIPVEAVRGVLRTIRLPGRLTAAVDGEVRRWLADAAIDARGVQEAVHHARRLFGAVDYVLVSLPDSKDVERTAAWLDSELGGDRWTPVIPPGAAHLAYSEAAWKRPLVEWQAVGHHLSGRRTVVAVGSWSFMSAVLASLGVSNEQAFQASAGLEKA
ncbi:MAG TPA: hypothetical protein VGF69_19560 [Thermoanaerobaculia bacterium]